VEFGEVDEGEVRLVGVHARAHERCCEANGEPITAR
jgi:hypothetical protein